jgi:GTP-binding protein Era
MKPRDKCGYVAIIGRPNVGKSTLLNALIGEKISIISRKPQTTRNQILGIKTIGTKQAIFIDTPGLHKTEQRAINRYMNRLASSVIADADVVIFMVDSMQWQAEDELVTALLKTTHAPIILVINKADLIADKSRLLPYMKQLEEKYHFAHIFPMCARRKDNNILELEKTIMTLLPDGTHLFPNKQITDKNERFQTAELIREKLIRETSQEVPYATTVTIESFKIEKKILEINAIIWVEKDGQKPIVIGKSGARLKKIGTSARVEIEKLLKKKVFLRLWVKVKENWTDSERALQSLGYE